MIQHTLCNKENSWAAIVSYIYIVQSEMLSMRIFRIVKYCLVMSELIINYVFLVMKFQVGPKFIVTRQIYTWEIVCNLDLSIKFSLKIEQLLEPRNRAIFF